MYGSTEVPPAISDSEDEERIERKIITSNRLLHKRQRIVYKMEVTRIFLQSGDMVTEDLKVTEERKIY